MLVNQNKRCKEPDHSIGRLNAPQHPSDRMVHGEKKWTPLHITNPLLIGMALLESGGRQVWVSLRVALAVSPASHSTTRAEKKEDGGGARTGCCSVLYGGYWIIGEICSDKHEPPPNATKSARHYGTITRNHPVLLLAAARHRASSHNW